MRVRKEPEPLLSRLASEVKGLVRWFATSPSLTRAGRWQHATRRFSSAASIGKISHWSMRAGSASLPSGRSHASHTYLTVSMIHSFRVLLMLDQ